MCLFGFRGWRMVCCYSVARPCLTLCDPMHCSTHGFCVLRYLPEFTEIRVHWVGDPIQPSHPLLPPPSALSLSQHQGVFQWVGSYARWPRCWSFSFSIGHSSDYWGLISLRNDWFLSPGSPRDSQESSPTPQFKSTHSWVLSLLHGPSLTWKGVLNLGLSTSYIFDRVYRWGSPPQGLPLWLGWCKKKKICLQCRRLWFHPCIRKITWRRKWQPSVVFSPGKSRGQRSLVGCSPWRHKESDMTKWLSVILTQTSQSDIREYPLIFLAHHPGFSSTGGIFLPHEESRRLTHHPSEHLFSHMSFIHNFSPGPR